MNSVYAEVMLNSNHLLLAHLGFYYPKVYFKYKKFKRIIDIVVMTRGKYYTRPEQMSFSYPTKKALVGFDSTRNNIVN